MNSVYIYVDPLHFPIIFLEFWTRLCFRHIARHFVLFAEGLRHLRVRQFTFHEDVSCFSRMALDFLARGYVCHVILTCVSITNMYDICNYHEDV